MELFAVNPRARIRAAWTEMAQGPSLRTALESYLVVASRKRISEATKQDYRERAEWLIEKLGEHTTIEKITYLSAERLIEECGPGSPDDLMHVTLRKRLRTLRAALALAYNRGQIDRIWDMPIELHDDGQHGGPVYTASEFERFAEHAWSERFRRFFQLGFWTGHHRNDIQTITWEMLDPYFEWKDGTKTIARGRWWRRNHKNKRCVECWIPMQPEFALLTRQWAREKPKPADLITGPCASTAKAAEAASTRAKLHYVRPNLGMRSSFASMLAARGYSAEYIRQALAHEGNPFIKDVGRAAPHVATARPTMASSHYLRPNADLWTLEEKRRR